MEKFTVTPRFCETDALGHINNTSYFIYLEEARIKFFQSLGYSMNLDDWKFILASTKCDFVNQGHFNQKMSVSTYISKIGNKSFHLEHEICCEETNQMIATGNAVIVFFNFKEQRSEVLPELFREQLERHLVVK
ncbi:acyl-CoA thioesterase [Gottfriedia acidiceleris]|uniref:acyl-CoA thioesterase n=1 Tax=Gottfriedia acidiceleris TaxID=371036 RepID=UPI00101BF67A|nr:thioesterase family protein [Gottfriedia acidiceleris]